MKKKHRNISALCLTALLVCLLPVNTMLATAESSDSAQDASSGAAVVAEKQEDVAEDTAAEESEADTEDQEVSDAAIEGTESGIEESDTDGEEDQEVQDTESGTEGEQEAEPAVDEEQEIDAEEETGLNLVSVNDAVYQPQVQVFSYNSVMEDNSAASVITIILQGEDVTQQLGGSIDIVKYLDNYDQSFEISGSGVNGGTVGYYLSRDEESMDAAQLEALSRWSPVLSHYNNNISFYSRDGKFVLYVKVEVGGQTYYARSSGVMVDTVAPQITGVSAGGTYKAGTTFTVQDDNLETVKINEVDATPDADGNYRVKANGNSCVIKATDKANHETTVSITVVGGDDDDDNKDDDNKDDDNDTTVISESRAYSLKAGTAYRLGSGTWNLSGDSTVYQGGITFYVAADGEYTFNKRK